MKATEEKREEVRTTHTVKVTCDLCGREAPSPHHPFHTWAVDTFAVTGTTVELREGVAYPDDDGDIKTTSFDICPQCFRDKLVPWLKEHGVSGPTVEESE